MIEEKKLGVPQPDDDVINKEPKVLLIGYGWVGQYCGKYFTQADIYASQGHQRKEIIGKYDLAIISVPTPMDPKTGQCDTSIVENMVELFQHTVNYFLIKSTVEIGTTDRLAEKYKVKIAMSPEYIGETLGHPLLEARRDAFQIIGGTDETAAGVAECWKKVLHASAPIMICTAKEAEIIKYSENYALTTFVNYWNDIQTICDTLGVSFDRVREGLVLDPRVGRTHSNVYQDNRGWSGKCLPKDMNELARKMRSLGTPLTSLEQFIEKNATEFRGEYQNKERLIPEEPAWKK
jgi:UDPglucose 6-dehydrogenase